MYIETVMVINDMRFLKQVTFVTRLCMNVISYSLSMNIIRVPNTLRDITTQPATIGAGRKTRTERGRLEKFKEIFPTLAGKIFLDLVINW